MSTGKALHGWTAVPRDPSVLLKDSSASEPKLWTVDEIALPDSPLAKEVLAYAKRELNEQTFNHSMRVYYYGEDDISGTHGLLGSVLESLTKSPQYRPRHPAATLSRLAPFSRDIPPHSSVARHRHNRYSPLSHITLIRILRRFSLPVLPQVPKGARRASRSRC